MGEDIDETVTDMRHEVVRDLVTKHIPERAYAEQWDVAGLKEAVSQQLNLDLPIDAWAAEEGIDDESMRERIVEAADKVAADKSERFGPDVRKYVEKTVVLQTLDHLWREHLVSLDHLRSVIGFRGYGQRDPLNEYKSESFELFQSMLSNLRQAVTAQMMRVELVKQAPAEPVEMHEVHPTAQEISGEALFDTAAPTLVAPDRRDPKNPSTWGKIGRNETCPCGSGKKFKHCHGALV